MKYISPVPVARMVDTGIQQEAIRPLALIGGRGVGDFAAPIAVWSGSLVLYGILHNISYQTNNISPSRIILIGNVALESARGPISTVSESLAFSMTCHPYYGAQAFP